VAFLAAKAFDFRHGNALNSDIGQSRANVIQFKGLDNRNDQFHADGLPGRS
jgi:hypothetical protein